MRRLSLAVVITLALGALSFMLATTGCDQLNKPFGSPSSSSSGSTSGAVTSDSDASVLAGEGGAPAPSISAQPGDIHL